MKFVQADRSNTLSFLLPSQSLSFTPLTATEVTPAAISITTASTVSSLSVKGCRAIKNTSTRT